MRADELMAADGRRWPRMAADGRGWPRIVPLSATDGCMQAYFKMDGALIDDRRIKVDFSQVRCGPLRASEGL